MEGGSAMRAMGCLSVGKEGGTEGYRMRLHFVRVIRIRKSRSAKKLLPKERIGQATHILRLGPLLLTRPLPPLQLTLPLGRCGQGRAQMSVRAEGREEMRMRELRQGKDSCQRCQRMQRMRQETFPGVAQLCVMMALFSGPCLVHLREP